MLMDTQLAGFGAGGAADVGNDAFTVALLHCDGADASTTITNSAIGGSGTFTAAGNAQIDDAQSVFGGTSLLLDGTGDYVSSVSSADWNLEGVGAGDYTIDFRLRFNSVAGSQGLVGTENAGETNGWLFYWAGNAFYLYEAGNTSNVAWTPSTGTWYHVAIVRSGGTVTVYINGISIGTLTDRNMNNDSNALVVGAAAAGASTFLNGWIDEFRLSKGIARWIANFTPPVAAYS